MNIYIITDIIEDPFYNRVSGFSVPQSPENI